MLSSHQSIKGLVTTYIHNTIFQSNYFHQLVLCVRAHVSVWEREREWQLADEVVEHKYKKRSSSFCTCKQILNMLPNPIGEWVSPAQATFVNAVAYKKRLYYVLVFCSSFSNSRCLARAPRLIPMRPITSGRLDYNWQKLCMSWSARVDTHK